MVLCEDMDSYHCVVINPVVQRLAAVCNSYNGTSLYDTRQKKRSLVSSILLNLCNYLVYYFLSPSQQTQITALQNHKMADCA